MLSLNSLMRAIQFDDYSGKSPTKIKQVLEKLNDGIKHQKHLLSLVNAWGGRPPASELEKIHNIKSEIKYIEKCIEIFKGNHAEYFV